VRIADDAGRAGNEEDPANRASNADVEGMGVVALLPPADRRRAAISLELKALMFIIVVVVVVVVVVLFGSGGRVLEKWER
jgi:hypothetical protein